MARSLSHCDSSRIAAVHLDTALAALLDAAAFPALPGRSPAAPHALAGAWAARQQPAASAAAPSADAEDVLPKAAAPAGPYLPPALRPEAGAATLAGCCLPRPAAAPQPAPRPAPYVPPHRRTAEQQAAAAAAPRPGRPFPFPALTAGPQPLPQLPPLPLYRLALLFPSQALAC